MNIVLTGSLGHIGNPLATGLVEKGHAVTVISRNAEKQDAIGALGAKAAIGSLEDADFVAVAFAGADAVFAMVPPNYATLDTRAYYQRVGRNYARAIRQGGIKRVVHLSSYGADLDAGTGPILGAHDVERILNELPGVALTHLRPAYFYYNLYSVVGMIKKQGIIRVNYGGHDKLALVDPRDIAAVAAEALQTLAAGPPIRYIGSDERTADEIAHVLGRAIGRPDLRWEVISDEEMQRGLEMNGVPPQLAINLVDMFASLHRGDLSRDYYLNRPAAMGSVKLEDFADEFAAVYKE